MATSICKKQGKRLLKCFCGCGELTEEEVQHIYRLSVQATLNDDRASQMLMKFLESQRSGDKSIAEIKLDLYKKCAELLQEQRLLNDEDFEMLDEDYDLPYRYLRELRRHLQPYDATGIEKCLLRAQRECCHTIEETDEYKDYKRALLRKLKDVK